LHNHDNIVWEVVVLLAMEYDALRGWSWSALIFVSV